MPERFAVQKCKMGVSGLERFGRWRYLVRSARGFGVRFKNEPKTNARAWLKVARHLKAQGFEAVQGQGKRGNGRLSVLHQLARLTRRSAGLTPARQDALNEVSSAKARRRTLYPKSQKRWQCALGGALAMCHIWRI